MKDAVYDQRDLHLWELGCSDNAPNNRCCSARPLYGEQGLQGAPQDSLSVLLDNAHLPLK